MKKKISILIIMIMVFNVLNGINCNKKIMADNVEEPIQKDYLVGSTIFFGEYPQEKEENNNLLDELNKCEKNENVISYNNRKYYSDNRGYFKYQPIEWEIIDEDDNVYTLISKKIIEKRVFGNSLAEGSFWSGSDIRDWLNSEFYDIAFNENEKNDIIETEVLNVESDYDNKPSGGAAYNVITNDKVFLLSYGEFNENKDLLNNGVAYTTDYVDLNNGSYGWWLRGPKIWSYGIRNSYVIDSLGDTQYYALSWYWGIRPVVKVKKESCFLYNSIDDKNNNNISSDDILINSNTFPDDNFREYIMQEIDTDNNGYLDQFERNISYIDCSERNIEDLKGIEYFPGLVQLYCGNNKITNIDISKNTLLKTLSCYDNKISDLDVLKNVDLEILICSDNNLSSLDVSKNLDLYILLCGGNHLQKLDLSHNYALKRLYCMENELENLNLSSQMLLEELIANDNKLTSIKMDGCIDLNYIDVHNNELERLNMQDSYLLKTCIAYNNNIKTIIFCSISSLDEVMCWNNYIEKFYVPMSKNFKYISDDKDSEFYIDYYDWGGKIDCDKDSNILIYSKTKTVFDISDVSIKYKTQVQSLGWEKDYKKDGETSGTVGKAKRLETIRIKLIDENGYSIDESMGYVEYRAHVQKNGWEKSFVKDDALSGTLGKALRLEAIQIRLSGDIANDYDVYYRVQAEKLGWLGWAKNGEESGSAGYGYRLEAIQIKLVKKGEDVPVSEKNLKSFYDKNKIPIVAYKTQVQTFGWEKSFVSNGETSGTVGKAKRLEAIQIKISNNKGYSGGIRYKTHVQKLGWQNYVSNGLTSGTVGKGYRLEAIQIELTGDMANYFDVYYRVQAQKFGWMGWAKNGTSAGTSGFGYRLEAIRIQLVYKNTVAPGNVENCFKKK